MEPRPLAELRRIGAKIDGDVPDMSCEDANEFALRLTQLIVKAAKHAPGGEGLIVLSELGRQARG